VFFLLIYNRAQMTGAALDIRISRPYVTRVSVSSQLIQRPIRMTPPSHVYHVTSLERESLQPYLTLRRPEDHWRQGIFVAEGEKVVRRLIDSRLTIVSFLMSHEWYERMLDEKALEDHKETHIYVAEGSLLRQIVGFRLHQCILAVARVPPEPSDSILPEQHLLLAIDGLAHAENVGVVVRNCAAFGVDRILVGQNSCSPYLRRSVRNSMGTVFGLRVRHPVNLAEYLVQLKARHGTRIVGTDAHTGHPLDAAHLQGSTCIVLGNEDSGISPDVHSVCDEYVTIPMWHDVDSVNVASAAGIVLYEARRQRGSTARGPRDSGV
jgi:tRNA G18 (ribose-2'-O)-methylase SpoU